MCIVQCAYVLGMAQCVLGAGVPATEYSFCIVSAFIAVIERTRAQLCVLVSTINPLSTYLNTKLQEKISSNVETTHTLAVARHRQPFASLWIVSSWSCYILIRSYATRDDYGFRFDMAGGDTMHKQQRLSDNIEHEHEKMWAKHCLGTFRLHITIHICIYIGLRATESPNATLRVFLMFFLLLNCSCRRQRRQRREGWQDGRNPAI